MTSSPLAFVDVETDGLRPDCRVWEVAVIRRDHPDDGPYREVSQSVKVAIDAGAAEPRALDFGGYYQRHPDGIRQAGGAQPAQWRALTESDAACRVAQWTHGCHLVGVNPAFDAERLDRMLRRHGFTPGWHYHLVDVLALAAAKLGQRPPWKSDDLAARLGVEPPGQDRHTAAGDAMWAARIYDAVMGGGLR